MHRQERGPVILVLDETLQKLPWESMDILKGYPVSRCPSLEYVEAAIRRYLNPSAPAAAKGKKAAAGRGNGKAKKATQSKSSTTTGTPEAAVASFSETEVREEEKG